MTDSPRSLISDRDSLADSPAHDLALACVEAGIEAARPERAAAELDLDGDDLRVGDETYDLGTFDELLVLGGGKASDRLAAALEDLLGERIDGGAVVVPHSAGGEATDRRRRSADEGSNGEGDPRDGGTAVEDGPGRVHRLVGSHPVPDEDSVAGARRVLELARGAGDATLVLAVVTGGGSALLAAPAGGITLDDLQTVTEDLLDSGATIQEVNAVRKHCSTIKGGQLARAAAPATVVGLVMSDVVGDDLGVIASGPTAPDPTTYRDALTVLDRYGIRAPTAVRDRLERGEAGNHPETPKPGDPTVDSVNNHVLANAHTALEAARSRASERGYDPLVLSARVRGEAREAALTHVAVAEEILDTGNPISPPAVVLTGGETTVTVQGDGTGGPNQEFALGAALEIPDGAVLASVDTDGLDGSTDAAGGLVDPTTVGEDANEARDALADNDAYRFLDAHGSLVRTGPTGTNVNDLRIIVVD